VFAVAQKDGCTFALRRKIFKTFTAESFFLGRYDWYHFFFGSAHIVSYMYSSGTISKTYRP